MKITLVYVMKAKTRKRSQSIAVFFFSFLPQLRTCVLGNSNIFPLCARGKMIAKNAIGIDFGITNKF